MTDNRRDPEPVSFGKVGKRFMECYDIPVRQVRQPGPQGVMQRQKTAGVPVQIGLDCFRLIRKDLFQSGCQPVTHLRGTPGVQPEVSIHFGFVLFRFTDIYGQNYWTPVIP